MSETRIKISSLEKEFDSLNSVFTSGKVKSGDTVTLLTDVVIENPVVIEKSCSVDLGGHFIFIPMSGGLTIKGGAAVAFDNGSIQTLADTQVEDAIISQGSKTVVTLKENLRVETSGTAIHARKRGGFIVDGAVIKTIGSQSAVCVDDTNSSLVVNKGEIVSYVNSAISVRNGGSAMIKGGKICTSAHASIPEDIRSAIIVNGGESNVTVLGGSIFSDDTVAIQEQSGASVDIRGGEIYTKNNMWPTVELSDENTSLKISGGQVYSTESHAIVSNKTEVGYVQHVEVTGGKVGAYGDVVLTAGKGDHGVVFSGGAVKGDLDRQFLAEGYVVSDIKDDEGYANIVLKTWYNYTDDSPVIFEHPEGTVVLDSSVEFSEDEEPLSEISFDSQVVDAAELPESVESVIEELPESVEVEELTTEETSFNSTDYVNTSVNIKTKTYIYRIPGRKRVISEWRGVLLIKEIGHFSSDGEEFALVKFKQPGSGKNAIGYVSMKDVIKNS